MAEILFLLAALLAGLHALSYARWLRLNGNTGGAWGVWVVIAFSLILPVYRLVAQP